jgi:hypothetical protein
MLTHVLYGVIFIVATFCYLINKFENSSGKGVFAQHKMCFFKKRVATCSEEKF